MKTLVLALTAAALVSGAADAQGHSGWGHDQGANHHWNRGERMGYNDWRDAQPVDYRAHHLRAPPRGYEWRESNGQYVLAAVTTGLIASIILANAH
jgi:Ni/Co efflux regulator RcnB